MTTEPGDYGPPPTLTSHAYEISVDDGRDSFTALSIEGEADDTEWLISDTVRALENMR